MRVGVDGRKLPRANGEDGVRSLDVCRALGLDGVFFRTVLDMSARLDLVELREIRTHADELDLYLEAGLGKVNPYALPEAPEIRAAGGGDTRLGFERMMRACAEIGCRELWVATANYKAEYRGNLAYDRFRTDVTWSEQLRASESFLKLLAPVARELDIHMNLETHEEITTFEAVRLVEAVGPDVMGITFDVGNVVQRGESPARAAERVAPYVRQTHLKDVALAFAPDGVERQPRPCGQGVVDFDAILPVLAAHRPSLHFSIENQTDARVNTFEFFNRAWHASHVDLATAEVAELVGLINDHQRRVDRGDVAGLAEYGARPFGHAEAVASLQTSADYLRAVLSRHDLL
jgi:sugar phosphate isomerase/epimerase